METYVGRSMLAFPSILIPPIEAKRREKEKKDSRKHSMKSMQGLVAEKLNIDLPKALDELDAEYK